LDIVVKVFKSGLEKLAASNPSAKGFILDGFPRSEEQASKLEELCQEWGAQVAKVIYLNVDLNIVKQRATGRLFCKVDSSHVYNLNVSELAPKLQKLDEQGQPIWLCDREHPNLTTEPELYVRKDDEPETVKKRLDEYQKETNPLINYFREQGQLAEIEGAQSPDKVTEDIKAVLTPVLGVPVPELSARL
jgi:adenylate kinase